MKRRRWLFINKIYSILFFNFYKYQRAAVFSGIIASKVKYVQLYWNNNVCIHFLNCISFTRDRKADTIVFKFGPFKKLEETSSITLNQGQKLKKVNVCDQS